MASVRALAIQEQATLTWYAVQMDGDCFAIFDTFEGEPGRHAHLDGPIAAALISKADELLAASPKIQQATVLADKAD